MLKSYKWIGLDWVEISVSISSAVLIIGARKGSCIYIVASDFDWQQNEKDCSHSAERAASVKRTVAGAAEDQP